MAKRFEKKDYRILDQEEIELLVHAVENTPLYMPTMLALKTGMRPGEILGLSWDSVDLDKSTITVRQAVVRTEKGIDIMPPKTEKGYRSIPIDKNLVDRLRQHKREQEKKMSEMATDSNSENLVCTNKAGEVWDPGNFTKRFAAIVKGTEIPYFRFYDLRRTHVVQLLEAGIDIRAVSRSTGIPIQGILEP